MAPISHTKVLHLAAFLEEFFFDFFLEEESEDWAQA